MKVRKPVYSDITDLDLKLYVSALDALWQKLRRCSCEFEQNIPFSLRCRAALLATPSRYPQLEAAIAASPEPSRRSLTISFQVSQLFVLLSLCGFESDWHQPANKSSDEHFRDGHQLAPTLLRESALRCRPCRIYL